MTTNNGAGGLVAKWRADADFYDRGGEPDKAIAYRRCADELEAALQAPGEAVPCKTVIVYGDHGPEEREPVEDYYTAPPSDVLRRVVEALELAREFGSGLPHSLGYEFTHLPKIDAAIAAAHKALAEGVDCG